MRSITKFKISLRFEKILVDKNYYQVLIASFRYSSRQGLDVKHCQLPRNYPEVPLLYASHVELLLFRCLKKSKCMTMIGKCAFCRVEMQPSVGASCLEHLVKTSGSWPSLKETRSVGIWYYKKAQAYRIFAICLWI